MYITLENGIEGLVTYRDMDGYFTYNANTLSVYSSDRMYKIGDKVNIVVIKANKKEGKIDFMLQEDYDIYYGDEI